MNGLSAPRFFICAFALLSLLAGVGCSSLERAAHNREFVLENSWARTTTAREYLGFRRMNRMSPIVSEKFIVQGNAIDGIVAYERGSGREVWRLKLTNGVEGGAQLVGDRLYFGSSDGQFYCVNLLNGSVLWTFPVRAETLAPPIIEAGIVYFESGADVVYALDAATGKQLWVYNRQVTGNLSIRSTTRPTIAGENLLVGFSDGFVVSLRKRDGVLVWERKLGRSPRFKDVDSTPVLDGKDAYVASFDAALYSLNIETGEINWTVEGGAYVPVTLGTGPFADRIFYSTANGKILAIDKRSGKTVSEITVAKGIATQPVLYKGFLVYGESEGALVVADAEKGRPVARFEPGHGIIGKPVVIDSTGEAYFISNGANLYAMKLGFRRPEDVLPWQMRTVSAEYE